MHLRGLLLTAAGLLAGITSLPAEDGVFPIPTITLKPQPADVIARHDAAFASVQQGTRTFRADITQRLTLQGLARPVVSKGTLYYASPDKLLIRFSQPAGEWMLVNGSQSAIQKTGKPLETHDLATQGRSASHAANLLDFFRADPTRWHKDFDVTMFTDGYFLWVHLKPWMTPTSTSQGVKEVVTALKLPNYDIAGMIVDLGSAQVEYDFTNGQRNAPIDPTLFKVPTP
jgi:outer membrane lipoprotein-sorting protein